MIIESSKIVKKYMIIHNFNQSLKILVIPANAGI